MGIGVTDHHGHSVWVAVAVPHSPETVLARTPLRNMRDVIVKGQVMRREIVNLLHVRVSLDDTCVYAHLTACSCKYVRICVRA